MSENTRKLTVLRTRTDHDLLILIQRELNKGYALATAAASRNSPLFAQAHKALGTAATLLPRIPKLEPEERLRIEGKVKELRCRLDQIPAFRNLKSYPASFAS